MLFNLYLFGYNRDGTLLDFDWNQYMFFLYIYHQYLSFFLSYIHVPQSFYLFGSKIWIHCALLAVGLSEFFWGSTSIFSQQKYMICICHNHEELLLHRNVDTLIHFRIKSDYLNVWFILVLQYEHMILLDLLKKGHSESERKIGSGVRAFQIRFHPQYKSRCFFLVREDDTVDDFSFRKCVDQIQPLPANMQTKHHANGGGRGGGYGRGRGRGGRSRYWKQPTVDLQFLLISVFKCCLILILVILNLLSVMMT